MSQSHTPLKSMYFPVKSTENNSKNENNVEWKKMNSLEWIDFITEKAGTSLVPKSLRVDTKNTSIMINPPHGIQRHLNEKRYDDECISHSYNNKKRTRECLDTDNSQLENFVWHPSIPGAGTSELLFKIRTLAALVEALPNLRVYLFRYKMIQNEFESSVKSIYQNDFEHLCLITERSLNHLLSMAQSHHSYSEPVQNSKQNFTEYMNLWLKNNWTNPYADEDTLKEIATNCNVDSNVVKNWLINSRTRKWRPAMEKAYQLGRPAKFLMEDAIHIFEGKPLQDIGTNKV